MISFRICILALSLLLRLTACAEHLPNLPVKLGEVAAARIGRYIYVVGQESNSEPVNRGVTLAFDIITNSWRNVDDIPKRPYPGNHHASVVYQGKWYLFGGLEYGSECKMQIYNPGTNSWTSKNMPFEAGSANAGRVKDSAYICGGISNHVTVNKCYKYSFQLDTFTEMSSYMPVGVNHAAHVVAGKRLFVLGGRDGDNAPSVGFDHMQVLKTKTGKWVHRSNFPLPAARGGMGAAIKISSYLFVFGGETKDQQSDPFSARKVYKYIDYKDLKSGSWHRGPAMLVPRHGIWPVKAARKVYVFGGGENAGYGQSDVATAFTFEELLP